MIWTNVRKLNQQALTSFDGLNKVEVKEATIGSIVAISGIADIHIGDTSAQEIPEAIPSRRFPEPTGELHQMTWRYGLRCPPPRLSSGEQPAGSTQAQPMNMLAVSETTPGPIGHQYGYT